MQDILYIWLIWLDDAPGVIWLDDDMDGCVRMWCREWPSDRGRTSEAISNISSWVRAGKQELV